MAEAVGCSGGRLTWNGIGMHGAGSLQRRIDRILSGEASRATPRMHKILTAIGCASAIIVGAGCRQATSVRADSVTAHLESEEKRTLGALYSQVLMGEPEAYRHGRLSSPDYNSYVTEIRQRLGRSRDVTLLLDTAGLMVTWGRTDRKDIPADLNPLAYQPVVEVRKPSAVAGSWKNQTK